MIRVVNALTTVIAVFRATREYSIDRPGGDCRSLEVPPDPASEPGKAACDADNKSRAWTCAPRLSRAGSVVLPQGPHQTASLQAVLHFRRGAVRDGIKLMIRRKRFGHLKRLIPVVSPVTSGRPKDWLTDTAPNGSIPS